MSLKKMERKEQRKFTRWQIHHQAKVQLEGALAPADCHLRDISFKGVGIVALPKLPVDTFLKLKLCLSQDCAFDVEVWIVWRKTIGNANSYGLYFSKISDSDKEKIYKFMLHNFSQLVYNRWWETKGGGEAMEDRRIFARFKAQLPVMMLSLNQNKENTALASDFSAKGIGLVSNTEVAARTPVEMWLQIPDKGEPLYTRGEVVWTKKTEPNTFRVGVNLESADLMGLSRLLRIE